MTAGTDEQVNRHIVPNFYRVLQEQDQEKQIANAQELQNRLSQLITVSNNQGPFFLGPDLSLVDVEIAPWIIRLSRVLKPYRGWPDPEAGTRWAAWVNALEANQHIKATTSTDQLYMDSYERYARECLSRMSAVADKRREPPQYIPGRERNQCRNGTSLAVAVS